MNPEDLKALSWELPGKPSHGGQTLVLSVIDGHDGLRYRVGSTRICMDHAGDLRYEPLPSARDDDFLAECRWTICQESLDAIEKLITQYAEAEL